MAETGADGVMIARAALFDPQIFCAFTGKPTQNKKEMIEEQLKETRQVFDERFTTVFMRKMVSFYIKGMRGAAAYKERLFSCQTPEEILRILDEIFAVS